MNQRCTVQELHRGGRSRGQRPIATIIGKGDRHTELWTNPCAAGEDGILHGLCEQRRALGGGVLCKVFADIFLAVE